jgi:hypothetical protein
MFVLSIETWVLRMFGWICGAGSLLPIEATRPALSARFLHYFHLLHHSTDINISSHQFTCEKEPLPHIKEPMRAYHKAEAIM